MAGLRQKTSSPLLEFLSPQLYPPSGTSHNSRMPSLGQKLLWICIQCNEIYRSKRNGEEHSCIDEPEDRFFCLQPGCKFGCWQERVVRRHCDETHKIKPAQKAVHWVDLETADIKQNRKARIRCIGIESFPFVNYTPEDANDFSSETDTEDSNDESIEDGAVHPDRSGSSEISSTRFGQPDVGLTNDSAVAVQNSTWNTENVPTTVGNSSSESYEHHQLAAAASVHTPESQGHELGSPWSLGLQHLPQTTHVDGSQFNMTQPYEQAEVGFGELGYQVFEHQGSDGVPDLLDNLFNSWVNF